MILLFCYFKTATPKSCIEDLHGLFNGVAIKTLIPGGQNFHIFLDKSIPDFFHMIYFFCLCFIYALTIKLPLISRSFLTVVRVQPLSILFHSTH